LLALAERDVNPVKTILNMPVKRKAEHLVVNNITAKKIYNRGIAPGSNEKDLLRTKYDRNWLVPSTIVIYSLIPEGT